MHLILDIGNTNVKYHLFDQEECVLSATVDSIELVARQILVDFSALSHVIYSDVRGITTKEKLQHIFPQLQVVEIKSCLLYTSPSPRDRSLSRMPSSA